MSRINKVSPETIQLICDLRRAGNTVAGIVVQTGRSASTAMDGKKVSVRGIDNGLLAAVRIIRSKQGI